MDSIAAPDGLSRRSSGTAALRDSGSAPLAVKAVGEIWKPLEIYVAWWKWFWRVRGRNYAGHDGEVSIWRFIGAKISLPVQPDGDDFGSSTSSKKGKGQQRYICGPQTFMFLGQASWSRIALLDPR
jgi:hypothetical protein